MLHPSRAASLKSGLSARPQGSPLLPVRGVVSLIDQNENKVLSLVESGEIPWAFDISGRGAGSREIRILPECVEDYQAARKCRLQWPAVIGLMLPPGESSVPLPWIYRLLNCAPHHAQGLMDAGLLRSVRAGKRGPGNAAQVSTASVIEFLKKRRIA